MKDILLNNNPQLAVIGGGSWATALVKLLTDNGHNILWYLRNNETISYINSFQHNPTYLRAVELDTSKIQMSSDINEVVERGQVIIFAIPSAFFYDEVKKVKNNYDHKLILSAVKGFVSEKNLTVSEFFHTEHNIPFDRLGVISGPCHAEEVSMERLSYITISSKHIEVSEYLCNFFKNFYIKTVPNTDIYGVEYASALKNVYAVAAGICHGLGYGDNFMSVLITCAFNEMKDFLNQTHPDQSRVTTRSAYLGDLLVTCYSQFSRNRTFGSMIGKGYTVESVLFEMKQVAEGYFASKSIHCINSKLKMKMPVADAVYSILYEKQYPKFVMRNLTEQLM